MEEAQAARQCVTEGQAMVVLLDYTLAPSGKNILTAPEIVDAMRASMADNKDSPGVRRGSHVPEGVAADALHLRLGVCAHGAGQ